MKTVKHILIMIALLGSSMPCLHAVAHESHDHADSEGKSICAAPVHSSDCHSCDETHREMTIQRVPFLSAQSFAVASSPVPLFILSETRLAIRQPAITPHGVLSSLQTVRLLT
jgi:hypothetical protein